MTQPTSICDSPLSPFSQRSQLQAVRGIRYLAIGAYAQLTFIVLARKDNSFQEVDSNECLFAMVSRNSKLELISMPIEPHIQVHSSDDIPKDQTI